MMGFPQPISPHERLCSCSNIPVVTGVVTECALLRVEAFGRAGRSSSRQKMHLEKTHHEFVGGIQEPRASQHTEHTVYTGTNKRILDAIPKAAQDLQYTVLPPLSMWHRTTCTVLLGLEGAERMKISPVCIFPGLLERLKGSQIYHQAKEEQPLLQLHSLRLESRAHIGNSLAV